jgi:hypothetical protein
MLKPAQERMAADSKLWEFEARICKIVPAVSSMMLSFFDDDDDDDGSVVISDRLTVKAEDCIAIEEKR